MSSWTSGQQLILFGHFGPIMLPTTGCYSWQFSHNSCFQGPFLLLGANWIVHFSGEVTNRGAPDFTHFSLTTPVFSRSQANYPDRHKPNSWPVSPKIQFVWPKHECFTCKWNRGLMAIKYLLMTCPLQYWHVTWTDLTPFTINESYWQVIKNSLVWKRRLWTDKLVLHKFGKAYMIVIAVLG